MGKKTTKQKPPNIDCIKLIFAELEITEIYIVCSCTKKIRSISVANGKKNESTFENNWMDFYTE